MSQSKRVSMEGQTPSSYFTISQACLGSPLQFQPAMGSQELEALVDAFVPGNGTLQQKRAQVSLDFFNAIELFAMPHPVTRRYQLPSVAGKSWRMETQFTKSPSTSDSSPETAYAPSTSKSLKRAGQQTARDSGSSKRLPGFSIMTRDGVDITEYASRGPKTKAQRDHAALMRKLKACGPCKRSKQRCDPSHHGIVTPSSPATSPSSATPSLTSASWSSTRDSQASISPQSAVEDSFNWSPSQEFSTVAFTGREFDSPKSAFASPSDMSLDFDPPIVDMHFNSSPLQEFDAQFFQDADMGLNFSDVQHAAWSTWDIQGKDGQFDAPSVVPTSSRLSTDQDWDTSTHTGISIHQWSNPTQNVNDHATTRMEQQDVGDYVLYPDSPQVGHMEQIVAADLSLSDNCPVPKSMTFNFDGTIFRRHPGTSIRKSHQGEECLRQSPNRSGLYDVPQPSSSSSILPQLSRSMNSPDDRYDLSHRSGLEQEQYFVDEPPQAARESSDRNTQNSAEKYVCIADNRQPILITVVEVARQVATNDCWLAQRVAARAEFRRFISLVKEAQISPDSGSSKSTNTQDLQGQFDGDATTTNVGHFRSQTGVRHYKTVHNRNSVHSLLQWTAFNRSSSQEPRVSPDKYGYSSLSLLENKMIIRGRNANAIHREIGPAIDQGVMLLSPRTDNHDALLHREGKLQTMTAVRKLLISEQKSSYSDIEASSQIFELENIPTPYILENTITASSSILEQAVHVMRLTVLLSMSLVDYCKGIVITERAVYHAMIILTIGTMIFYPQWAIPLILIFTKTVASWPNVTAAMYSHHNCPSSSQNSKLSSQSLEYSPSQGIQERIGICSSTPTPRLTSGFIYGLVAFPSTRIERLYSLTSTLNRYCNSGNFARQMTVLRV